MLMMIMRMMMMIIVVIIIIIIIIIMYALSEYSQTHIYEHWNPYTCRKNTQIYTQTHTQSGER
jgi:uncharacterized protein YxeA